MLELQVGGAASSSEGQAQEFASAIAEVEMLKRDSVLIIGPSVTWTWKTRLAQFVGAYGLLWLFLEPLPNFVGEPAVLSGLGAAGYGLLLLAALLGVLIVERVRVARLTGSISYIVLTIELVKTGIRIPVKAPKHMLSKEFVSNFLEKSTERGLTSAEINSLYHHDLHVKQGTAWQLVPGDSTLQDAGLRDGDLCQIHTTILVPRGKLG